MKIENSVGEYADYIDVLSERTQEIYLGNIQKFLAHTNKKTITSIVIQDVNAFLKFLKESQMRAATISNYVASIRSFFKYHREVGNCNFPYQILKQPKIDETQKEYLKEHEFELIDDYLDDDTFSSTRKRIIFRLLWDTGCRINEILKFNLEDIDVQKRNLTIKRQKSFKKNVICWSEDTHELLLKYLGVRLSEVPAEQDALFTTDPNIKNGKITRLTARSVQRWIKNICLELGIDKYITPHSLRHSKAHNMLFKKAKLEQISGVLGHTHYQSAMVYIRLNEEEQMALQEQFL